ncbi:MAG: ferredoxin [Gammaproteobacteria bacterium]|nr:MAG: ferredoxin [Gammaproteobacteria bacterium]
MSKKLADIEGIGPAYAEKLASAGLKSQEQLLEVGSTPAGRKKVAEQSGCSEKQILNWVNRADLARVSGIGGQYADLLECAGVDTIPELAQRNAENLHAKMTEVNEEKNLVRKLPTAAQVADWVAKAKELPRAIHYK